MTDDTARPADPRATADGLSSDPGDGSTDAESGRSPTPARDRSTHYSGLDQSGIGGGGESLPEAPDLGHPRYTVLTLIARGGQGDVWRVNDDILGRDLAVKIVRPKASKRARQRFHAEIERTVRLAHPGVVPVFDRGVALDGRPWFAMKRVEGEHLGEVVQRACWGETRLGLRRLIELVARICGAVAHAHERGLVHRDLKPRNIMVGAYDEALVMDWGLARELPEGLRPRRTRRRSKRRPAGTRGYIAPECYADPRLLDVRADVFGLGAILFKVLTGTDPAEAPELTPLPADFPRRWVDGQALPPDLVEICVGATEADPDRRIPTAALLRQRLIDWLDGARRRDEALRLVGRARGLVSGIAEARREVRRLQRRAAEALQQVPGHAPAVDKHGAWSIEDEARREADALAMAELDFEGLLGAALTRVPDLYEAHALLADHHRARLVEAEARRDRGTARRAEALLRQHDRGAHAEWLTGQGRLTLHTAPTGARVTLHRLVLDKRRLVPAPGEDLGRTPIVDRVLSRGSYLAVIEADDRPPVRYPIHLERGGRWDGVPPGEAEPRPVPLPPAGLLGPDDVYVPPGWAIFGGDESAPSPLPRCRLWVDGYVIQRYSVTHRQWLAFLEDSRLNEDGWERFVPRHRDGRPVYASIGDALRPVDDLDSGSIELDAPVTLVDWHGAMAYAGWKARQMGIPWRLPTGFEWEKAARGVDGRPLPWGDYFEPSWARTLESFPGPPRPVVVGECPEDESVYGVRDMAGTVRNWCCDTFVGEPPSDGRARCLPAEGEMREVRGGSSMSRPLFCRPAGRFASRVDQRFRVIGFRLACPWPG